MKNASRLMGVLGGWVVLIGASCLWAQDWPQWRGPNRNDKIVGFSAPAAWPKALTQQWRITVGLGDATPALVGDRLYVFVRQGGDEAVACLAAADGKQLWQSKYEARAVEGAAARHPGPRSSPTVAEGKVVTLGVGGVLSCFDAADGKLLWRKDEFPKMVPQFFAAMSPIVIDGMCVAHLGGKDKAAVIAYQVQSGEAKWKWAGDGPAYGSPVEMTVDGTKQLVVQTDKNLVGLAAADGKLLWQIAAPTQRMFFNSATPIVDGQTLIYSGQGSGTKAVKIEKQGDGFAVKELWSNESVGTGFNTPVLKDGLLFGVSNRGSVFCLSAGTGKTAWVDEKTRRENFAAVIDVGPALLVLPSDGELLVLKPTDKEYEELARYKVADTPTYAHPVVAGNRIYVKDKETLTLWTL